LAAESIVVPELAGQVRHANVGLPSAVLMRQEETFDHLVNEHERDAWDERVAIGMADGGLLQAEAEKAAWQETTDRRLSAQAKGVERG
jgi:hypothetical protein